MTGTLYEDLQISACILGMAYDVFIEKYFE
jgi:hypothetical protein